jgi:hypothetical protein
MSFDFDKAFVAELEARGVTFESTGDGFYRVVRDGHAVQINTQNIRAEALRDDDPSAIGWFLDDEDQFEDSHNSSDKNHG